MSVTYLATACAALRLGLTRREGREVVMEQETLVMLVKHIVNHLLIVFGTQSDRAESLSLTTCEE